MSSYFKMCQQEPNSDLGHDRDRHENSDRQSKQLLRENFRLSCEVWVMWHF